jgi:hypothetical protein
MEDNLNLSNLSPSLKTLVTCLVLCLAVGYGAAFLQVFHRTSLKTRQTVLHFRGDSENPEIHLPQSDGTLISVAHVHSFSQPVVIGLMSFLFSLTAFSQRTKIVWIVGSFLAGLVCVAGPWLIRDISPRMVILLYSGGLFLFISFAVMASRVLYEVWWKS